MAVILTHSIISFFVVGVLIGESAGLVFVWSDNLGLPPPCEQFETSTFEKMWKLLLS